MEKKKFAIVTGTRAEYGLFYPLIRLMAEDDEIDLDLIVTGAHLSQFHGNTIEFIKKDRIKISHIIDMGISGDTEDDICGAISTGLGKFSTLFTGQSFDALIVLGDRYELWAVCIAAVIHKIPIVHINGGEVTSGATDDCIRHSITKMASIHFPSIDIYAKRIIQMGENPKRVHVVGSLAMDNMRNMELMSCKEISDYTGLDFSQDIALMTYHPVTLHDITKSALEVKETLEALLETNLITLITMPNADAGSKRVYDIILDYSQSYPDKFQLRKSLGQKGYLSAMKYAKLMIGNSSSGIGESPYFKLPVINIGDRQKGRFRTPNVIDCKGIKEDILKAIQKAFSRDFVKELEKMENPYGDGTTAIKIVDILKNVDFSSKEVLLKKSFYDFHTTRKR